MVSHRLTRPGLVHTVRKLGMTEKIDLISRFLFHVIGVPVLLFAVSWIWATIWLIVSLLDLHSLLVMYRRVQHREDAVAYGERQVLDDMTQQPGGAPTVADLTAHCGCVHRYAYDQAAETWRRVEVVRLNEYCPLVDAHAHNLSGAYS